MRSTASERLAGAFLLGLFALLARAAASMPAQTAQGGAPATPQETIQLEQVTVLYEGPSPVFKRVAELKPMTRVLLLAKQRAFARMREVDGTLEGYGLLPAPKRVEANPGPEHLTISVTPSPTVVSLVTKGLAERLRASRGGDPAAVDRMEQLRFTPEQFLQFLADLGR